MTAAAGDTGEVSTDRPRGAMVSTASERRGPGSPSGGPTSVRQQRAEASRFRRSLTLVGLTVVAPGSAQFTAGNRQLGKIVLQVWAGLVVVGALVSWLPSGRRPARLGVRAGALTPPQNPPFSPGGGGGSP